MKVKMSRLRKPSASMVVACLALFVALTGSAVAAGLAANSVGSKQLKKNAVTSTKIKSSTITGSKVKNDSLTGSDINESTLATVPSASNATNATNATNAQNAATVAGSRVVKFEYNAASGAGVSKFFDAGGLSLSASCPGALTALVANTTQDDSALHWGAQLLVNSSTAADGRKSAYGESDDFDASETVAFNSSGSIPVGELEDSIEGTFTYTNPGGSVITATYTLETDSSWAGRTGTCHVIGTAVIG